MPAWKTEPLITDPPMEQWPALTLPWQGFIRRIESVNIPNLRTLYCDSNAQLSILPWNDLQSLNTLGLYSCGMTILELWRLANLNTCYASENYNLTQVDAHGNTALINVDFYNCTSLVSINVQGCTALNSLYAYSCALPQASMDQILADLVANGVVYGHAELNGGKNAAPSNPGGLALKNILISRGWTVTTN